MDPAGAGAEFRIPSVGRQHGGSYSCSYQPWSEPFISSQPSDSVQLVVAELSYPKPSISLSPSGGVSLGAAMTVRCRGQHRGMRFVLNKEGRHFPPVDSDGFEAEFSSSNVHRDLGGSYSCSYHSRLEPFTVSYPSDPMELVVRGRSESPAPLGLTSPIIAGASAAAAGLLLLLLLVAFVRFRKTRVRKRDAPSPSSTIPLGVLKAPAQEDPIYASIDEWKQPQALEPSPGTNRLIYAELDRQALQAEPGDLVSGLSCCTSQATEPHPPTPVADPSLWLSH
ncbi:immunoglobulin superfamily member 1-like [Mauremys reevesii]|uniref:immunoglobulin superfamily member 1-like n=1 Tax=Mauremys reevesii TaxID=260615 RepID=UPI00193EDEFE|nr:immunoglobulin superfamily member 1-like [Mauremys reevesii]